MMNVADLLEASDGQLVSGRPEVRFTGVTTDSRTVQPGELFVALVGPNFDGHAFAEAAVKAGAAGVLASRPVGDLACPVVRVDNTRDGLGRLAAWWRDRFAGPVIALTGSNGKTTVKEMLAAILRQHAGDPGAVLATQGNLNNDIGVPLTLLTIRPTHRYAVIEMGMNHLGEIDYLTRITRPGVALVNNAQRAHVGELGSIEMIARSKGEIFAGLDDDGIAVINADDDFADYWRGLNAGRRQITFGLHEAQVRGHCTPAGSGWACRFEAPGDAAEFVLPLPGEHSVRNALAATAAAFAVDVGLAVAARVLAGFAGAKGRLERKPGAGGSQLIDDTYNANPDSMAAAIRVLAAAPGTTVFVMGDMGELGEHAATMHAEVGRLAAQAGIRRLLTVGELSRHAAVAFGEGARHFTDADALVAALEPSLAPGVTVLIKGSRFMRMERVVAALAPAGSP